LLHPFEGHRRTPALRFSLSAGGLLFSTDGARLCSWDVRSWTLKESLAVPAARYHAWFPWGDRDTEAGLSTEKMWYIKDGEKHLELRDVKTDRLIRELDVSPKNSGPVRFSAAGNRFALELEKSFAFYDAETGERLSSVPRSDAFWMGFNGREWISARGSLLAMNDEHKGIDLFEVKTGKKIRHLAPNVEGKGEKGFSVLRFALSDDEKIAFAEVHDQTGQGEAFHRSG
jgi:hypothetical protein